MVKIGNRIRRLRLERNLSQKDVAEPLMTPSYLSLIESGQRMPSEGVLRHVAERLGVEPDELLTGKPSGLEIQLELSLQEARTAAYQGKAEEAQRILDHVLKAAARYRLSRLQARALIVGASVKQRRSDFEGARQLYDEAQNLLRDAPAHVRFEAVVGHAQCTNHIEGPRLAIHLLEGYLLELEHSGLEEPTARMRALSALVELYRAVGYHRRAIEVANESIALGSVVKEPEQIACMSMNVARALLEQGRHDDALEALRRADQIYQSLDWPVPGVRSKINRGIVEIDKGNLEDARTTFHEVLDLLDRYPDDRARAGALDQLGRTERLLGDNQGAIEKLSEARALISSDDVYEKAFNAREIGLALSASRTNDAEQELRKSADLYKSLRAFSDAGKSLLELGRLLRDQGRTEEAARILEEGLELNSSEYV